MKSGFFLDIVVAECSAVFELFTGEDQSLLIRGDTLLVLDLRFNVVDGIRRLDLERDGFTSQSLDENLHTTT